MRGTWLAVVLGGALLSAPAATRAATLAGGVQVEGALASVTGGGNAGVDPGAFGGPALRLDLGSEWNGRHVLVVRARAAHYPGGPGALSRGGTVVGLGPAYSFTARGLPWPVLPFAGASVGGAVWLHGVGGDSGGLDGGPALGAEVGLVRPLTPRLDLAFGIEVNAVLGQAGSPTQNLVQTGLFVGLRFASRRPSTVAP